MAAADIVGENFLYRFFVFIVLHHPTGVCWVLLGLSRRQYKVYDKKISPTNKETLKYISIILSLQFRLRIITQRLPVIIIVSIHHKIFAH